MDLRGQDERQEEWPRGGCGTCISVLINFFLICRLVFYLIQCWSLVYFSAYFCMPLLSLGNQHFMTLIAHQIKNF